MFSKKRSVAGILMLAVVFCFAGFLTACTDDDPGYDAGYNEGYDAGYNEGYADGYTKPVIEYYTDAATLYESKDITANMTTVQSILPAEKPAKAGYDFIGWFWDDGEFKQPFNNVDFILHGSVNGVVKLYAKFEAKTGLIINQAYGIGDKDDDGQAGSNSFVELYNTSSAAIDLTGYSLQIATNGVAWTKLDLSGTIPAKHSFLVALTKVSNSTARLVIDDYDLEWADAILPNKDFKVVLTHNTDLLTTANPFADALGNRAAGYVDMIGIAGNDDGRTIDGYETDYLGGIKGASAGTSKQKAVRRIDLTDTDNNALDCETLDYRTAELALYAPKSTASGQWTA